MKINLPRMVKFSNQLESKFGIWNPTIYDNMFQTIEIYVRFIARIIRFFWVKICCAVLKN